MIFINKVKLIIIELKKNLKFYHYHILTNPSYHIKLVMDIKLI